MKNILFLGFAAIFISCCNLPNQLNQTHKKPVWQTDFFDDFDSLNSNNWQDQLLWVNNEKQCYVANKKYNTLEVKKGILKVKVIRLDHKVTCSNVDKNGNLHPPTEYVAGRICSKNKIEFVKGKWTARIRLQNSSESSMFPAFWLLGANNNEPPVQEKDEIICWPLTGSGEIDIFEHHGDVQQDEFTAGAILSLDSCNKGDWWTLRSDFHTSLTDFHEYGVAWENDDLVYYLDGKEIHRNAGEGLKYPEPMFAIINFAKISDTEMKGEWVMEVDWVKHEYKKG